MVFPWNASLLNEGIFSGICKTWFQFSETTLIITKPSQKETWISHCSKSHDFIAWYKKPGEKVWEAAGRQSLGDVFWHREFGSGTWQKSSSVPTLAACCLSSLPWLNNYVHQGIHSGQDLFSLGSYQKVIKHGAFELGFYTEKYVHRK